MLIIEKRLRIYLQRTYVKLRREGSVLEKGVWLLKSAQEINKTEER